MNLVKTFQAVEETQFLKKISSYDRLFFVGETEILEYIKNFFLNNKSLDNNYYYDLSVQSLHALGTIATRLTQYQGIIVASFELEETIQSQVKQIISVHNLEIGIFRLFGDVFINHVCRRSLLQPSADKVGKPGISYAVITTPRSGSTYFCDLLDSTKVAGYPAEHLRLATQELSKNCNFDYLRLLNNLVQYRVTDNGIFGTKLISHFLFELHKTSFDFDQIFLTLDKFIFLTRRNKLAQAVSLVIAQQTEVWHLRDNLNKLSYQAKLENIVIDDALLDNVEQKLGFINRQEERLKKIMARHKIEPLLLVYEDVVEAPHIQINHVLDFLQVSRTSQHTQNINSGIKKMPSSISQEIMSQFRSRKNIA